MKILYSLIATIVLIWPFAFVTANQKCEYRNGVIVETRGVCPRGTTRLSSSGGLGSGLSGLFTNQPKNQVGPTGQPLIGNSNATDLLARSAGGLLGRDVRSPQERYNATQQANANAASYAVERKLNVIKEIDLLLQSGSISKDMADKLKAEALR